MDNSIITIVSQQTGMSFRQVAAVVHLLDEGATIPFIARYRKEVTGNLNEEQIALIKTEYDKKCEIADRKSTILATIEKQGQLNPELKASIESCWDSNHLEDLYLPYKPKKRTRAMIAREKGLEPLAVYIMKQVQGDPATEAAKYLCENVKDIEEALQGAMDIIAEQVNENKPARDRIRVLFKNEAVIRSQLIKAKKRGGCKI